MKRTIACLLTVLMLVMLVPSVAYALDTGEMLIVTDPETVVGEVGEIIRVNFFLYPNLPENMLLNSIQGVLLYDPEMLTFGAIITKDEEQNIRSFIEDGKSTMRAVNTSTPGEIRFAYIDVYGWKGQGFWMQIEFRVEKEGASAFLVNSIRYNGLDQDTMKSTAYYIEPTQVGAVSTGEEETVPTDAAADMTYEPLAPEIDDTPKQTPTPTPKPQNSGQTVPVTSALPTIENAITPTPKTGSTPELVTPQPAVTSMPMTTIAPGQVTQAPADAKQPDEPGAVDPVAEAPESNPTKTEPEQSGTTDPAAESQQGGESATDVTSQSGTPGSTTPASETAQPSNLALTIAVIAGIVMVVALAAVAIVLILVRKKRMDAAEDDEEE